MSKKDTIESASEASAPRFVVKRQITASTLKLEFGIPVYVKFLSEPEKARPVTSTRGDGPKMEPPTIARVANLETGEICTLVLGTVLLTELTEAFPEGLTGHTFSIEKHKIENKAYHGYAIAEIEA